MARHARVEVDSVQRANKLSGYLEARGLKAQVEAPMVGAAAVLVRKPPLRRATAFLASLLLVVDGWVKDGHADKAIVAWQGERHELESLA